MHAHGLRGDDMRYKKEFARVVYDQMIKGKTISYICEKVLRVQRVTFYKWMKDEDKLEFRQAVAEAKKAISDEMDAAIMKLAKGGSHTEVTKELRDGAMIITKKVTRKIAPDMNAVRYYKNNIDPANWRERRAIEHSGEVKMEHTLPPSVLEILQEAKLDED